MPTRKEVLEIGGREVTITNPDKVYFPDAGYTKMDLVSYYLVRVRRGPPRRRRPADGPQAVRRRDREGGVLPEARPGQPSRLAARGHADLPVGPDGRRDRDRRRRRAWRGSPTSAASTSTRIPSAPRTSTIPTSCGSTSTRCRASSGPRSATWRSSRRRRSRRSALSAGRRRPARAGSTSTSGSSVDGRTPRSAARRWPSPATSKRRAPDIATSKWWKEERHGVFLDYNQNAKDRTVASAYSVRPLPDARVSFPLRWEEVADVQAEEFTIATVPKLYASRGDAGAGIDDAVGIAGGGP